MLVCTLLHNGHIAQLLECSLSLHVMCHGVECSKLDNVTIFDNTSDGVFSWNFNMSGYGIQWNPPGIVHGIHVESTIPCPFHVESMVGME